MRYQATHLATQRPTLRSRQIATISVFEDGYTGFNQSPVKKKAERKDQRVVEILSSLR